MPIGQDAEGPTSLCFSPTVGCQIRDTGVGLRFAANSFNLLNDDQKIPGGSFCSVGTTFDASREATGDTDWRSSWVISRNATKEDNMSGPRQNRFYAKRIAAFSARRSRTAYQQWLPCKTQGDHL